MDSSPSDLETLKTKLKATWMAGDFGVIAKSYEKGAAHFVDRLKITPGDKALDIACGTGNLAIPATKCGANVIGVDIATNLIEQTRVRARTENVTTTFEVGDAEQLPYDDSSFDTIMTMYGAMFAPRPDLACTEMLRVCRTGGALAMANWTPMGFVGQLFKIVSMHVPPLNIPSPIKWGEEETVRQRFGDHANMQFTTRLISFTYPFKPEVVVDHLRLYFGPTHKAFEALEANPDKQAALQSDLTHLWTDHNQRSDGTTFVEAEYLEVHATKR